MVGCFQFTNNPESVYFLSMITSEKVWQKYHAELSGWPCPECNIGFLDLEKETLKHIENGASISAKECDAWEPDWIEERFSCLLKCKNDKCLEVVSLVGRTHHARQEDWERQEIYYSRQYEPKAFYPAVPIFRIPENCPQAIVEELTASFSLYWSDIGSSANRLRRATEAFLTKQKIPKTTLGRNRKRIRLNLQTRIEKYSTKDNITSDYLLAVKWLGNEASHHGVADVSRNDLLDAFQIFEQVILRTYVKAELNLRRKAKAITSRKGKAKTRQSK